MTNPYDPRQAFTIAILILSTGCPQPGPTPSSPATETDAEEVGSTGSSTTTGDASTTVAVDTGASTAGDATGDSTSTTGDGSTTLGDGCMPAVFDRSQFDAACFR